MSTSDLPDASMSVASDASDAIDAPFRIGGFLGDAQWAALERVLPPPDTGNFGQAEADRRAFVEALLWMAHQGRGWSELPDALGNAQSLRRKRLRWRKRGWLDLLQQAAPRVGLPAWLVPIAVVAFDPSPLSRFASRDSADQDVSDMDEAAIATRRATETPVAQHAAPVARLSRDASRGAEARQQPRQAQDGDARQASGPVEAPAMTVALDPGTIDQLALAIADRISAAGGGAGAGGRGRRGRGDLAVVWGDVPRWAKTGLAVVIGMLTAQATIPFLLRGMSDFAGDLERSFGLPLWAGTIVVVLGPQTYVLITMLIVAWIQARTERRAAGQAAPRPGKERAP